MKRDKQGEAPRGGDEGASAVEYGLLLGAIILVVLTSMYGFGFNATRLFENNLSCLSSKGEVC